MYRARVAIATIAGTNGGAQESATHSAARVTRAVPVTSGK